MRASVCSFLLVPAYVCVACLPAFLCLRGVRACLSVRRVCLCGVPACVSVRRACLCVFEACVCICLSVCLSPIAFHCFLSSLPPSASLSSLSHCLHLLQFPLNFSPHFLFLSVSFFSLCLSVSLSLSLSLSF